MPTKGNARIRVAEHNGMPHLYIKAPFLERLFKKLSKSSSPDNRVRTRPYINSTDNSSMYDYYIMDRLPRCTMSLQPADDVFNNACYLRAVGTGRGLWVPLNIPMTKQMRIDLANRVKDCMISLYQLYCSHFEVDYKFTLEE